MGKCPLQYLPFAKEMVKLELWKPTLAHTNILRSINGVHIEELISSFQPESSLRVGKTKTFFTYTLEGTDYSRKSIPHTLSELGYAFYIHCIWVIPWIQIKGWRILSNSWELSNYIGLIYYAFQWFDVIFANAKKEELYDASLIELYRLRIKQLASIPDGVQKAVTEKMDFIKYIRENIYLILKWKGCIWIEEFRRRNILIGIIETQLHRNSQYWICPAVFDGTLDMVFDLLIPMYRLYK